MARFERYNLARCIKPAAPMQADVHVVVSVGTLGLVVRDRYGGEYWAPESSFELVEWQRPEDIEPVFRDLLAQMVESVWVPAETAPPPEPVDVAKVHQQWEEDMGELDMLLK